jgi:hypothetical protein
LNFSNDLGWRNNQNKSFRSQKLIHFLIDNFFIGIIYPKKNTFKIQNFQTTLDREMTKTKVIDPK